MATHNQVYRDILFHHQCKLQIIVQIEGILPKGPYLPCVSMAGRALWQDNLEIWLYGRIRRVQYPYINVITSNVHTLGAKECVHQGERYDVRCKLIHYHQLALSIIVLSRHKSECHSIPFSMVILANGLRFITDSHFESADKMIHGCNT